MHHEKLAKLPMLYMIGASTEGVIVSKERGGW
jgi:hypothetical protein